MRQNETTWLRAVKQARKIDPVTYQKNNSLFFDVASTSIEDGWHHVTLGSNKFNVFIDMVCDCSTPKYLCCIHRASAFLKYTANLETRLETGYRMVHSGKIINDKQLDAAIELWKDLLDRYERCLDLLRAIEEGYIISNLTKAFKTELWGANQLLLTA